MVFFTFKTSKDGEIFAFLPDDFTRSDLIGALPALGDLTKYRLVVNDQVLCLNNEAIFNRQKHLILDGATIILLNQATGGTFIEISLLKEMLLEDLKSEWPKIDHTLSICDFCLCLELCGTIHGTKVCLDCFPNYLKETNFELRCKKQIVDRNDLYRVSHRTSSSGTDLVLCKLTPSSDLLSAANAKDKPRDQAAVFCEASVDYQKFFKTPEFIDRWSVLCDMTDLLKNIDCQICYCGAFLVNMTLHAKQQCSNCQRWLCFFCNRTWDNQTMKDLRYTCTNECQYERRIEYELVPLLNAPEIMVPDRRCCPNCFLAGGYGTACKYHSCPYCRHQFCFMCLETEADCKTKHKSGPYRACTAVKKQDFSIFPRLHSS
ncbi:unnamed protein product [Adineta ricciae]|uniref:Uncharacterized protein n=1 Tax=Adineta ricciae TaxID=249248 RepID=A0A814MM37_ADIRI|nr:unnamed protein product [Adineta ricciae]CAF1297972.1 unnamed protein product [Adineta ricciae]